MRRTLLALALISTAGVSYAQTMQTSVDAQGRPIVGRNDWVRQPGDQAGPGNANIATAPSYSGSATMSSNAGMSGTSQLGVPFQKGGKLERSHATGPEPMPMQAGPRQVAFTDEYGFRYDSDGNRLDRRGNVISPHIPQR
jgi:hypothetical protein